VTAPPDPVAELFAAALEHAPHERAAFLAEACAVATLRAELHSLLDAYERSGAFLDPPSTDQLAFLVASPESGAALPGWIGPYRVLRELGQGGQGRVFLAERADGQFERRVAIKLLRDSGRWDEGLTRFLRERQILAGLDHPGIARLYDGGVTDLDQPWFAMEYVEGAPITAYCDERALDLEARLRLFADVLEAVGHAHRHQVVHRDLKPSNILVTAEGRVKLLDFGIAKALASPEADAVTQTARVMTPAYAAPEQVRGEPLGPACDVYALGAVLYELVTGLRAQEFPSRSPADVARVVCEVDPVAPSRSNRRLRRDLDAIVLKALRKEPSRRYATVYAMLDDLGRYRDGLPVTARRGSRWYRTRKLVARHRLQIATAGLVLALAGALVGFRARDRAAADEAARARELEAYAARLRDGVHLTTAVDSAEARAAVAELLSGRRLAFMSNRAGRPMQPDSPGGEAQAFDLFVLDGDTAVRLVTGVERPVWSPDGSRILFFREGDIYTAAADGGDIRQLTSGPAHDADPSWSPDGRQIAFGSDRAGNWDIFVMNVDGTGLVNLTRHPGTDVHPVWSPDGTRIAFDSRRDGYPEIYVMRRDGTGQTNLTRSPQSDIEPAWSPDGRHIAFASRRDGAFDVWIMNPDGSGATNLTRHPAGDGEPAWSPDGRHIVFASDRRGNFDLFVMRVDGTLLANLTHDPGEDMFPTWRR
jgi:predicted Ser/Thr protein kinase